MERPQSLGFLLDLGIICYSTERGVFFSVTVNMDLKDLKIYEKNEEFIETAGIDQIGPTTCETIGLGVTNVENEIRNKTVKDDIVSQQNGVSAIPRSSPKVIQLSQSAAPMSRFRQRRAEAARDKADVELNQMNIDKKDQIQVVGQIIERTSPFVESGGKIDGQLSGQSDCCYLDVPDTGFPIPQRRPKSEAFKPLAAGPSLSSKYPQRASIESRATFSDETADRIAQMTTDEIKMAQKEIEEMLGPDLIATIRAKQKKKKESTDDVIRIELPGCNAMAGSHLTSLKMSTKEAQKLEWTEPVSCVPGLSQNDSNCKSNPVLNLRFDASGRCLSKMGGTCLTPAPIQYQDHDLYHHGNEPESPGYTLTEIVDFWLVSVNSRQRSMALRLLESISLRANDLYVSMSSISSSSCKIHLLEEFPHLKSGFGYGRGNWDR